MRKMREKLCKYIFVINISVLLYKCIMVTFSVLVFNKCLLYESCLGAGGTCVH